MIVPGILERVVADAAEVFGLVIRLGAGWRLPGSGASTSDQDRGRGQAGVVEFGL